MYPFPRDSRLSKFWFCIMKFRSTFFSEVFIWNISFFFLHGEGKITIISETGNKKPENETMVRHRYEVMDGSIFIILKSSEHIKGRQTPQTADLQSLVPGDIEKNFIARGYPLPELGLCSTILISVFFLCSLKAL